jgi:hypothetical protein
MRTSSKNLGNTAQDPASDAPSDFLSDCAKIMQAGSAAMFTAVVPKPFPLGFGLSPVKGFLCGVALVFKRKKERIYHEKFQSQRMHFYLTGAERTI